MENQHFFRNIHVLLVVDGIIQFLHFSWRIFFSEYNHLDNKFTDKLYVSADTGAKTIRVPNDPEEILQIKNDNNYCKIYYIFLHNVLDYAIPAPRSLQLFQQYFFLSLFSSCAPKLSLIF